MKDDLVPGGFNSKIFVQPTPDSYDGARMDMVKLDELSQWADPDKIQKRECKHLSLDEKNYCLDCGVYVYNAIPRK